MRIDGKKPGGIPPEPNKGPEKADKAAKPEAPVTTTTPAAPIAKDSLVTGTQPLAIPQAQGPDAQSLPVKPLAADNTKEISNRLSALLSTLTAPPSGEIGKAMTVTWAQPTKFVALTDLLTPTFVTTSFTGELPQDPALRDRALVRMSALKKLLTGGEAKAASKFLEQAPQPLRMAADNIAKAADPAFKELARSLRQSQKSTTKPESYDVPAQTESAIESAARSSFSADMDIESLVAIVMQQAAKDATLDLKEMLKTMEAQRKRRESLRKEKQSLQEMKSSLETRSNGMKSLLETEYHKRGALSPDDPRYVDEKNVSFESYLRGQPIRVVSGTLDDVPYDAKLGPTANETLYPYASPATLRLQAAVPFTQEQLAAKEKYRLSDDDVRALAAVYQADKQGAWSFDTFLATVVHLDEYRPAEKLGGTVIKREVDPTVPNQAAVHGFMLGLATYDLSAPSSATKAAMAYPEGYATPPKTPKLTGELRIAQMKYGLPDRDVAALKALYDLSEGTAESPRAPNFDAYLSRAGFQYDTAEHRAANASRVRPMMERIAHPQTEASAQPGDQIKGWYELLMSGALFGSTGDLIDQYFGARVPEPLHTQMEELFASIENNQHVREGENDNPGTYALLEEFRQLGDGQDPNWGPVARAWITLKLHYTKDSRDKIYYSKDPHQRSGGPPMYDFDIADFPFADTLWPLPPPPREEVQAIGQRWLDGDNFGTGDALIATALPMPITVMTVTIDTGGPADTPPDTTNEAPPPVADEPPPVTDTPPPPSGPPPRAGRSAVPGDDEVSWSDVDGSLRALGDRIDNVQMQMDTANELNDENQLRLQSYMERRSRIFGTLSNIMKKISDTAGQIAQNLK